MSDQNEESVYQQPPMQIEERVRPIVISTKKKKKRKYSRGLRDIQVSGIRIMKIADGLAGSTAKGIQTFRKANKKSAGKKRNGMLKDMGVNLGKAISKSLRASSDVPSDIAKAFNTRGTRRQMRRQLRAAAKINRQLGSR